MPMFFVLSFILSLASIVVTLKILIGYNPEFSFRRKMSVVLIVVFAWFAPMIAGMIRWLKLLPETTGLYAAQGLYALFITAMFLLGILLVRDLFWIHGYQIAKKLDKASPSYDPMKPEAIKKANVMAVAAAILLSAYSLYEGIKFPEVKETVIKTEKVSSPFKIAVLTDTHISRITPVSSVEKLVRAVNDLKPDMTVLVGDIGDSKPVFLEPQMQALSGLKAKHGVFVTLGNHEFYHGAMDWEMKFRKMGLSYLANNGLMPEGTNVFVFGLPDPQLLTITDWAMEGIKNNMKAAPEGAYRVLLSHSPRFVKRLDKDLTDLQISGHTHGGQIFPFHFFVKRFNDFVAGLYDVNGIKLYISRGAGGWGPPMRLFAPSEIAVITLEPAEKQKNAAE